MKKKIVIKEKLYIGRKIFVTYQIKWLIFLKYKELVRIEEEKNQKYYGIWENNMKIIHKILRIALRLAELEKMLNFNVLKLY